MNADMFAGLFSMVFVVGIYAFFAICIQTIAIKTQTKNAWWAWVPVLNLVLLLTIARKPMWWIVLFFIPFANIVATILVMMSIAEQREKPAWVGALVIVPFFGALVVPYFAFSS